MIPLLFLFVLPLAEIAGFVVVGREIGALATIALVLASGIAGSILLRWQGFGTLARLRADLEAGRDPGRQMAHGVMIVFAGILLIIPGFITDIVGILLFIPPVRDLAWHFLRSRVRVVSNFGMFRGGAGGPHTKRGPTIDLGEDDYTTTRNPDSPWRRIDDQ
ncbi:FxsA family protein [Mesorhizobium sp. LHD-90]|nr:FxsA family protein [Mesorhizobium sp. LHD-90]MDQ6434171.1 FxsA family protein [Mesorhizobium sp. LHD-90]